MDIDSDFCIYRGPEVFQHLIDKYGQSHVANVATFGRLQSKQVIKDIAKSFSIPFKEVNDFTRSIPDRKADGEPIKSFADVEETIEAQEFFKKYPEIAVYARKIEGLPRHISQHPAGIGVTPCDITDLIPVQLAKPNGPNLQPGFLAQYEKDNFEQAGVVKIDILKLKAATQIQQMINMINTTYKDEILDKFGKLITDEDIPMNDEKAWDLLCEGDALGIFQMEKEIGINTLKKVQPRNITELAAVTSFIRPGAAGLENYLETKKDPSKRVRYDPRLDKYLDNTYGAVAFQEEIMQLISTLMGISFGQADIYRRALEKPKKFPDKIKEFNEKLIPLGTKNGFSEDVCKRIYTLIKENSGYAFNASHAVAYSYITYWMAWIKVNFPLVWYTCMINDDISKMKKYMDEAARRNIKVLPPHVSYSKSEAVIESKQPKVIRIGFSAIKGIGDAAIEPIVANQPYTDMYDYFTRAKLEEQKTNKAIAKGTIEGLINASAFKDMAFSFGDEVKGTKLEGHEPVVLDIEQFKQWFDYWTEHSTTKAEKKYLILAEDIKTKFKDDESLVFEKNGDLVVPESCLDEFGFTVNDVSETRKKPKGRLTEGKKVHPIYQAFLHEDEIFTEQKATWLSKLDKYYTEIINNGISFIEHPLDWKNCIDSFVTEDYVWMPKQNYDGSFDEVSIVQTEGMIIGIDLKVSKKGNPYHILTISSPSSVSTWNVFKNLKGTIDVSDSQKIKRGQPPLWRLGSIVRIKGTRSKEYGSNSADEMKDITPYAYLQENYTNEDFQEHVVDLYNNAKSIIEQYLAAKKKENTLLKGLKKEFEKKRLQEKREEAQRKLQEKLQVLSEEEKKKLMDEINK